MLTFLALQHLPNLYWNYLSLHKIFVTNLTINCCPKIHCILIEDVANTYFAKISSNRQFKFKWVGFSFNSYQKPTLPALNHLLKHWISQLKWNLQKSLTTNFSSLIFGKKMENKSFDEKSYKGWSCFDTGQGWWWLGGWLGGQVIGR